MSSRPTKTSVTNFLYFENDYLFMKRSPNAHINPGEMNGIGGKLELGEDYLSAAIRETMEETGYKVEPRDIRFCGIIRFQHDNREDWVTCFFKMKVPDKNIPLGFHHSEGDLLWVPQDNVLTSGFSLVDDINYIFEDIVNEKNIFFLNAQCEDDKYTIKQVQREKLKVESEREE